MFCLIHSELSMYLIFVVSQQAIQPPTGVQDTVTDGSAQAENKLHIFANKTSQESREVVSGGQIRRMSLGLDFNVETGRMKAGASFPYSGNGREDPFLLWGWGRYPVGPTDNQSYTAEASEEISLRSCMSWWPSMWHKWMKKKDHRQLCGRMRVFKQSDSPVSSRVSISIPQTPGSPEQWLRLNSRRGWNRLEEPDSLTEFDLWLLQSLPRISVPLLLKALLTDLPAYKPVKCTHVPH